MSSPIFAKAGNDGNVARRIVINGHRAPASNELALLYPVTSRTAEALL